MMKSRSFDKCAGTGPLRCEERQAGVYNGVSAVARLTMAALAFFMIEAVSAVLSLGAYALSPGVNGTPASSEVPDGTPIQMVTGLNMPWSAVPVGDEVLISQRGIADIVAFQPGEPLRSVGIIPGTVARGDGGTLGLAVHREGADVWVYSYHSTDSGNRIVRMPYSNGLLGDAEIVLDGIPGGRSHNGGRIAFGPDGMLYATVGETRNPDLAQDLETLAGKILRMTPDGDIPDDNPFRDSLVYSYGHRNPQGLAWDDAGQLWATEFGNDAWDELNRIEPGGNYGWPIVEGRGGSSNYIDPVVQWHTQEMGPSGLAYIDGTFFIAGLTGQRLWSVTVDAAGNPDATAYYTGEYGRIRDVFEGSEGDLWFLTNTRSGVDNRLLSVPLESVSES